MLFFNVPPWIQCVFDSNTIWIQVSARTWNNSINHWIFWSNIRYLFFFVSLLVIWRFEVFYRLLWHSKFVPFSSEDVNRYILPIKYKVNVNVNFVVYSHKTLPAHSGDRSNSEFGSSFECHFNLNQITRSSHLWMCVCVLIFRWSTLLHSIPSC